jgi:uncharacterized protein (TIGR03382 family)
MRLASVLVICALGAPAAAEVELRNDSFEDGDPVVFQGGFAIGDIGASRFIAPEADRMLLKVQLLFGAATTTKTMALKVFDDSAETDQPSDSLLFNIDVSLVGSDTAMQEIPVPFLVVLPRVFRVGLEFKHGGVPTIANDNDMTNTEGRNFIFSGGTWHKSNTLGVKGDWIIRPFISGDAGPVGGPCSANPDCPIGEFCDTAAGTCAFECRNGNDCNGDTCNSLGQCVDGGGGCCDSSGGGEAWLGAGLFGVLVLRRRRRCAG